MPHIDSSDYKEFFDLTDIFNIIWKWKFLILGGMIFWGAIATLISMNKAKIYEVNATIRPGVLTINKSGKIRYFDRVDNISTMIQSGALNSSIKKKMKNDGTKEKPNPLRFSTSIPKKSQTIKITYETPNIEYGKRIIAYLLEVLEGKYTKQKQFVRKQKKIQTDRIKLRKRRLEMRKVSENRKIELFNSRIEDLKDDIAAIGKNLKEPEYLRLKNVYKKELFASYLKLEQLRKKITDIESKISNELAKLAIEESKNEIINAIQVIQRPYSNSKPTKPKIKSNIILALLAGLFLMIFIVFLLELKSKKYRANISDKS